MVFDTLDTQKTRPAFNQLLPIGSRDKGGPVLHLQLVYANLHFLLKLFV